MASVLLPFGIARSIVRRQKCKSLEELQAFVATASARYPGFPTRLTSYKHHPQWRGLRDFADLDGVAETTVEETKQRPPPLGLHSVNHELTQEFDINYLQLKAYNTCMKQWSKRYGTICSSKALLQSCLDTLERSSRVQVYRYVRSMQAEPYLPSSGEAVIHLQFPTRLVERCSRLYYTYTVGVDDASVWTHVITCLSIACEMWEEEEQMEQALEAATQLGSLSLPSSGHSVVHNSPASAPPLWNYRVLVDDDDNFPRKCGQQKSW